MLLFELISSIVVASPILISLSCSRRVASALLIFNISNVSSIGALVNYITYGKEVRFTSMGSLAPELTSFYPVLADINDTIYIVGEGFSVNADNNSVRFNNLEADIISTSQDTLAVLVPNGLDVESSKVTVSIFENEAEYTDKFNLEVPTLSSLSSRGGSYNSQITILGSNFESNIPSLKVFFDSYLADIVEVEDGSIVVSVPDSLDVDESAITVEMNNFKGLVNTKGIFSYGFAYNYQTADSWMSENYSDFNSSKVEVHTISPLVRVHNRFRESGFYNRFKIYLELGPTVGVSELSLEEAPFSVVLPSGNVIPAPVTDRSVLMGLNGAVGAEYAASQVVSLFLNYSYGISWISSPKLYNDSKLRSSVITLGVVFKLKQNKYYYE